MKHKVGDKVKIKSDLESATTYTFKNKKGDVLTESVTPDMLAFVGKEAEIVAIECDEYIIDIDGCEWYWIDEMFEENE